MKTKVPGTFTIKGLVKDHSFNVQDSDLVLTILKIFYTISIGAALYGFSEVCQHKGRCSAFRDVVDIVEKLNDEEKTNEVK